MRCEYVDGIASYMSVVIVQVESESLQNRSIVKVCQFLVDLKLLPEDSASPELRQGSSGLPRRGKYEQSTYLHLIDCYLEMKADRHLREQSVWRKS
jgi:hypothetical protein